MSHDTGIGTGDGIVIVRRLLAVLRPSLAHDAVVPLGAGEDHAVFQVGDDLLVRVLRDGDAASRGTLVEREARLLRAVAGLCPVPVPVLLFSDPEAGAIAYARLPGVPMISLERGVRERAARDVATRLGEVLAALHAAPVDVMREIAGVDERAPDEWRDEAAAFLARSGGALPPDARRAARRFVEAEPPAMAFMALADLPTRFTHNDLGIEHLLTSDDGARLLGVIDWSDAAVTDPAVDFARILRDLGPDALDAALAAYGEGRGSGGATPHAPPPGFVERAWFYARCLALEDLAFGVETAAEAYVAKTLDAACWLFSA